MEPPANNFSTLPTANLGMGIFGEKKTTHVNEHVKIVGQSQEPMQMRKKSEKIPRKGSPVKQPMKGTTIRSQKQGDGGKINITIQ